MLWNYCFELWRKIPQYVFVAFFICYYLAFDTDFFPRCPLESQKSRKSHHKPSSLATRSNLEEGCLGCQRHSSCRISRARCRSKRHQRYSLLCFNTLCQSTPKKSCSKPRKNSKLEQPKIQKHSRKVSIIFMPWTHVLFQIMTSAPNSNSISVTFLMEDKKATI